MTKCSNVFPKDGRRPLLALDGNTAAQIPKQLQRMPADATHLVLSVGGNDALGCLPQLGAPAANVFGALVTLSAMLTTVRHSYTAVMAARDDLRSNYKVSKASGIAHTTIRRAMNGEVVWLHDSMQRAAKSKPNQDPKPLPLPDVAGGVPPKNLTAESKHFQSGIPQDAATDKI